MDDNMFLNSSVDVLLNNVLLAIKISRNLYRFFLTFQLA